MDVKAKALTTIQRENMLLPGASVLTALSGGADSVALLHVLLSLKEFLGLDTIAALHVNHCLRGEESDRDEAFVRELCTAWSVPLTVIHRDVARLAREGGKGEEETGREIRYAALEKAAEGIGGHCRIATAHTLSDNMETVLLHLCRGSGLHGLTGIPPVRGRIIRPLLHCSRQEIEDYCRTNGLEFVTDSTNADTRYTRNRIRSCVVPELYSINPQLDAAMDRLIGQVTEADRLMEALTDQALNEAREKEGRYRRSELLRQPEAVKSAALYKAARLAGAGAEERHIQQLKDLLETGGGCTLPGNIQAKSGGDFLIFSQDCLPDMAESPVLELIPGRKYNICDRKFHFLLRSLEEVEKGQFVHKKYLKNALDYDKICGRLTIGIRQPGDAYHPAGRRAGKTLKKLFNEVHLPLNDRKSLPVVRDELGIVLVPGFGCDQRVSPGDETKRILIYQADNENERG